MLRRGTFGRRRHSRDPGIRALRSRRTFACYCGHIGSTICAPRVSPRRRCPRPDGTWSSSGESPPWQPQRAIDSLPVAHVPEPNGRIDARKSPWNYAICRERRDAGVAAMITICAMGAELQLLQDCGAAGFPDSPTMHHLSRVGWNESSSRRKSRSGVQVGVGSSASALRGGLAACSLSPSIVGGQTQGRHEYPTQVAA